MPCAWNFTRRGSYGTAELAVMNPACSKASGVALLAQHLGITMEEVMAIGDNNNDLEMLQAVGWSVAMGQAPEAIKAVANAVTTSNAEDGVALAIERYALGLGRDANTASNSAQSVDLSLIRRRLPALLFNQFQCIACMHTFINQYGTGEQYATPDAMLTVNQHTSTFTYVTCRSIQLLASTALRSKDRYRALVDKEDRSALLPEHLYHRYIPSAYPPHALHRTVLGL